MPIQSTSEGKISLAKGIIFTKIVLANGYILKLWAAPPYPKFSREPPRELHRWRQGLIHGGTNTVRVPTASEVSKIFTDDIFQIALNQASYVSADAA